MSLKRPQHARMCMATSQYPRRMTGTFIVNRQDSLVRKCLSSQYAGKIILQGTDDGSRPRGRPRKSWRENIRERTGHSLSSLLRIADDRSRWATIAADASVGVTQRRLGVMDVG